jgi:hypothetical protein
VRAVLALALLVVVGFAVTGCGSSQKAISGGPEKFNPMQITGTVTIPRVVSWHRIKCKGMPGRGVKLPPRGSTANVGAGKITANGTKSSRNMQVTHLENGAVIVSCTSK